MKARFSGLNKEDMIETKEKIRIKIPRKKRKKVILLKKKISQWSKEKNINLKT
jgi:hypothetical protein